MTEETLVTPPSQVLFAVYGFQVEVPDNWRVEMNPKDTQKKGDVAFHTPKGNRFFVSWGSLEEAQKRFQTLDQHRDASVKQVKKGPDVTKLEVRDSKEETLSGHRALFSHVVATVKSGGFIARGTAEKDMWSAHLYCPDQGRFYVIYCLLRDPSEYSDLTTVFNRMARSFACHRKLVQGFA